jgi:hypothetical protein
LVVEILQIWIFQNILILGDPLEMFCQKFGQRGFSGTYVSGDGYVHGVR